MQYKHALEIFMASLISHHVCLNFISLMSRSRFLYMPQDIHIRPLTSYPRPLLKIDINLKSLFGDMS